MAMNRIGRISAHLVVIILSCACLATSQDIEITFEITEELDASPVGTVVGDVVKKADLISKYPNDVTDFVYRVTEDGLYKSLFSVDETSGIIKTEERIDREALCPGRSSCSLVYNVLAISQVKNIIEPIYCTIVILDINDNPPVFKSEAFTIDISESAAIGTRYNLPDAQDADERQNGINRYELAQPGTQFELKTVVLGTMPTTAQLVLLEPLDREAQSSYQLTLTVFDGGEPTPKRASISINIVVTDTNDNGPRFLSSTYNKSIAEDTEVGTTLLELLAFDTDAGDNGKVVYHFASNTEPDILNTFALSETSGELSLKQPLDYESQDQYVIVVVAEDSGLNSQVDYATVRILVTDVNDNAPSIAIHTLDGADEAHVSEYDQEGKIVAHVIVRDSDGGVVECSTNNQHFQLMETQTKRFQILLAAQLDRELTASHNVTVTCVDQGSPRLTSTVTIIVNVMDENDHDPVFSLELYVLETEENNYLKKYIAKVNASDADEGFNAAITYSIEDDPWNRFIIDENTGVILANYIFDYEEEKQVEFTVVATDAGTPPRSSSSTVLVVIKDRNDEPPVFLRQVYDDFTVVENQHAGMEVNRVTATDADSEMYSDFKYSIQVDDTGMSDLFTIDAISGRIRTKESLDREEREYYQLIVVATNVDMDPPLSSTATVLIQVLDENDNRPVVDYPSKYNFTVQVSSSVPIGHHVALVNAHDDDSGPNAHLIYDLAGESEANELFSINEETGVIITKRSLSEYTLTAFQLNISVSDSGIPINPPTYASMQLVVNASIPYMNLIGTKDGLIAGTNVVIVISVAISTGIIVIILIVAIVLIKTRDAKRKQRHRQIANSFNIQPQMSDQKSVDDVEIGISSESERTWRTGSSTGNDRRPKANNNLNNYQQHSLPLHQLNNLNQKNLGNNYINNGRSNKYFADDNSTRIPSEKLLQHQETAWHQLAANKLQTMNNIKNETADMKDTDSVYSGDVSNTDSGRGASEEGDAVAINGVNGTPHKRRSSDDHIRPPSSGFITHPPQQHLERNPSSKQIDISQSNRNYGARHLPNYDAHRVAENALQNASHYPHHLRRSRSWDTLPEEDNASSTSGSYVVDSTDLYIDGGEGLSVAVTV